MHYMHGLYIVLITLVFALCQLAPGDSGSPPKPGKPARPALDKVFKACKVTLPDGQQRKYALFIPPQYEEAPKHKWPVILFLHGSGEKGTDGIRQTHVGLPRLITRRSDRFPFITIMPQAQNMWFRGREAAAVWAMLESVLSQYSCDPDRIYITGLSMGGFGTWELAMQRPGYFAAAVPVCGVGSPDFVSNIKHLPIWAFHGAMDKSVPVRGSRRPIEALKKLGAKPRYTEYPDAGHMSWGRAYATKGLWEWLLQQRRITPPGVLDLKVPPAGLQAWWLTALPDPQYTNRRSTTAPGKGRKNAPVAKIKAEIEKDGRIILTSEGVHLWSIVESPDLLEKGDAIEVVWNGKTIFQGKFQGALGYRPKPVPKPVPDSRPAD